MLAQEKSTGQRIMSTTARLRDYIDRKEIHLVPDRSVARQVSAPWTTNNTPAT